MVKMYSRPQTIFIGSENYSGKQNRKDGAPNSGVRVQVLGRVPIKNLTLSGKILVRVEKITYHIFKIQYKEEKYENK